MRVTVLCSQDKSDNVFNWTVLRRVDSQQLANQITCDNLEMKTNDILPVCAYVCGELVEFHFSPPMQVYLSIDPQFPEITLSDCSCNRRGGFIFC